MPRLGGNLFEGVQFPIAFGDRFVSVARDLYTGAPLVDVYRWDRRRERLIVEIFQGRPLPGAPPITVTPQAGAGGVRLGIAGEDPSVVGYLSGGDNPRYLVISEKRITVYHGERVVFEMLSSAIVGSAIGLLVDELNGIQLAAPLPPGFSGRRHFENATIVLTDLVGVPPVIHDVTFEDCRLVGPAIIAAVGPLTFSHCQFPHGNFVWELPATEGEFFGVIGLSECTLHRCQLEGIGWLSPLARAMTPSGGSHCRDPRPGHPDHPGRVDASSGCRSQHPSGPR